MVSGATCALILDFDGTVAIGDETVWAFARHICDQLTDPEQQQQVRDQLANFLAGNLSAAEAADGYQAVTTAARRYLAADRIEVAYQASRTELHTGQVSVELPPGLLDFLDVITAQRILVTNAPECGVEAVLQRTGLADRIDAKYCSAGKPNGLAAIVQRLRQTLPAPAICSVGDLHTNDLQPVLDSGGIAAYIDRFGHRAGPAHLRATTFEQLYQPLSQWAADPNTFVTTHPPIR